MASVIDESSSRRNSSTWRYFACRLGLILPSSSEMPSTMKTGSFSGSSRCLGLSWPRVDLDRPPTGRSCARSPRASWSPCSWWLWVAVSTCQSPNGSSSSASTASRAASPDGVVLGERLGLVVRRDLQVRPGLEVDVAQLRAPPGGLLALLPPGRDRLDQHVGVEDVGPEPVELTQQRLGRRLVGRRLVITHRRDDDDQQQRHQCDRDDETTVAGIHRSTLEAKSSARCIVGCCGEVVELHPAGHAVGEHHRVRVGAYGGQQVGLGDGDRHLVVPLLHAEVAGQPAAARDLGDASRPPARGSACRRPSRGSRPGGSAAAPRPPPRTRSGSGRSSRSTSSAKVSTSRFAPVSSAASLRRVARQDGSRPTTGTPDSTYGVSVRTVRSMIERAWSSWPVVIQVRPQQASSAITRAVTPTDSR